MERSKVLKFAIELLGKVIEDSYGIDQNIKNHLDMAYSDLESGNLEHAEKVLDAILRDIEANNDFSGNEESEFRTFSEDFEYSLHLFLLGQDGDSKQIVQPGLRFSDLYFVKALLNSELGNKDSTRQDYEKAIRWNPVSSAILNEYFLLCWSEGDLDKAFELIVQRLNSAFHRDVIADSYTKLGVFFRKKEQWQNAYNCFHNALKYEEDEESQIQLYSLIGPLLNILDPPDDIPRSELPEDKSFDSDYEVPDNNSTKIAQLAYNLGGYCLVTHEYDLISYYWDIAYDITHDDEIKKRLELLDEGRIQDLILSTVKNPPED